MGIATIGRVSGPVNIHQKASKKEAAKIHRDRADNLLSLVRDELSEFHKNLERNDKYIMDLVDQSNRRNEALLKIMEELVGIINAQREVIVDQSHKTQERADAIIKLLEKKIYVN